MIVPVTLKCEECSNNFCVINKYCHQEWRTLLTQYRQDFEYQAGEMIFREGEQVSGIYIVHDGKVKILANHGSNKSSIIRLASNNDILGHRGFGGNEIYPISAVALTRTRLTFITKEKFDRLLLMNNELCYWFMNFYAKELNKSENRTCKLIHLPVLNRLAMALIMVIDAFGYSEEEPGLLAYTPTRTELADLASTTYESLIRSVKEMERNQWIKIRKKELIITDEKAIYELVHC
ncbi:MAG: Crp/Fnr family transcriptional regulator [Cyclobacteriaceae bacterium]|nr:Crp/Fnr family transcriptional regulator [Cyclobacteriaceae bacterium]